MSERFRVDGKISKTLLVWTKIFSYAGKKDAFAIISGYVWTGPETNFSLTSEIR